MFKEKERKWSNSLFSSSSYIFLRAADIWSSLAWSQTKVSNFEAEIDLFFAVMHLFPKTFRVFSCQTSDFNVTGSIKKRIMHSRSYDTLQLYRSSQRPMYVKVIYFYAVSSTTHGIIISKLESIVLKFMQKIMVEFRGQCLFNDDSLPLLSKHWPKTRSSSHLMHDKFRSIYVYIVQ